MLCHCESYLWIILQFFFFYNNDTFIFFKSPVAIFFSLLGEKHPSNHLPLKKGNCEIVLSRRGNQLVFSGLFELFEGKPWQESTAFLLCSSDPWSCGEGYLALCTSERNLLLPAALWCLAVLSVVSLSWHTVLIGSALAAAYFHIRLYTRRCIHRGYVYCVFSEVKLTFLFYLIH